MTKKVRTLSTEAGNELARNKAAAKHEAAHAGTPCTTGEEGEPGFVCDGLSGNECPAGQDGADGDVVCGAVYESAEVSAEKLLETQKQEEAAKAARIEEEQKAAATAHALREAAAQARQQEDEIVAARMRAMHTAAAPPVTSNIPAVQKINRSLGGFRF